MTARFAHRGSPELESTLPVLGVRVRLRTNSPALLGAFEASLGRWRVLDAHPEVLSTEQVEGTITVRPADEGGARPIPVSYRLEEGGRLEIGTPGSLVRGDPAGRRFDGHVTPALLDDVERFRYKVLEAAVLSVVTHLDRQPVHASVIVRGSTALLLAGPSGTGKSTLSYAAARAGLAVLSEDTVFAQLRPGLRLWAMPAFVHVARDARRHFPELGDVPARVLPTGKEKIPVSLAALGAEAALPFIERAGICVVEREPGGSVSEEPLAPDSVLSELRRRSEPGFDLFERSREALVTALAPGGGWRLTLSADPREVVPALHRLLDRVDGRLGAAGK